MTDTKIKYFGPNTALKEKSDNGTLKSDDAKHLPLHEIKKDEETVMLKYGSKKEDGKSFLWVQLVPKKNELYKCDFKESIKGSKKGLTYGESIGLFVNDDVIVISRKRFDELFDLKEKY